MLIRWTKPENLTPKQRQVLFGLTISRYSMLSNYLRYFLDNSYLVDYKDCDIILSEQDNLIVGWGMLSLDIKKYPISPSIIEFMLYVRQDYRKQGIGTKLVNQAVKLSKKKYNKNPEVKMWSTESRLFFRKQNNVKRRNWC